jgi:2-oxoglutarate ferredoxin oxidoreductase subunit beta
MGPPDFPVPIGVFRSVEEPTLEEATHAQVDRLTSKYGKGDLEALLNEGDTWIVN